MTLYSPQDTEVVWQQTRALLQSQLSPAVYSTWVVTNPLTQLQSTSEEDVVATITAPSAFHAVNLKKNLDGLLRDSLESVVNKRVSIDYQVGSLTSQGGWEGALTNGASSVAADHNRSSNGSSSRPTTSSWMAPSQSSSEGASSLSNAGSTASPSVESLFSSASLQSSQEMALQSRARKSGLNPSHTFASYAVSGSNEMAHAAAVAVSQQLGTSYNPLFLYGDVGVGKTPLMHAVGNNVLANDPNANVLYCTGEDFTNDIVQAIQSKKAAGFKSRYRGVDLLLLDDVQFIAGKQAVQEEFFHTFNTLVQQKSQVVLTSDRPPEEISLLESRLRSRFEAGLIVDIGQPAFELRVAILLLKAQAASIPLTIDQAKLVSQHIDSPRRLEGFISRIRSEIELKKQPFSDQLITSVLEKETKQEKKKVLLPPQEIIRVVAGYFQLKPLVVRGMKRERHYVKARHTAMYILKEDARLSLTEIGRWFSSRDHTSVLHGVRRIAAELMSDPVLQQDVVLIRSRLQKNGGGG